MEVSNRRGPFNRSVRELNNKNNLASLRLKKELMSYDREKRFLIEHIEKNRVDTYSFLKQLQVCESNLVPAYKELLDGIITRPSMTRRIKRKAHTAPSTHSDSDDNKNQADQKQKPFVPKFTKAQIKLLQSRKNTISNKERAEAFLNKLREKQQEELELEAEDNQEPELAMSRKLSRLISFAIEEPEYHTSEDRWARPRGSGFHSIGLGNITTRQRSSEVFDCSLPALTLPVPDLTQVRAREFRVSANSPIEEDCFGRTTRKRPLDVRLRDFYSKLDILKKKQEDRMADLPIWEKRRRWIMLTRGIGAALAESDSESEDDMGRSGYY